MPSRCSAPGCKSNYGNEEQFPVFKMPKQPDELRQSWLRGFEILLDEITLLPTSENPKSESKSNDYCIASARDHIQQVIDNFRNKSGSDNELHDSPEDYNLLFASSKIA